MPNVKLIIGEPFASEGGSATVPSTGWNWDFDAFRKYREAALKIAYEAEAVFIPYQSIIKSDYIGAIFRPAQAKPPKTLL